MFDFLFYLAIGLTFIAVVGHALWVTARTIFRALTGGYSGAFHRSQLDTVARYYEKQYQRGRMTAHQYTQARDILDAEYRALHIPPPPRYVFRKAEQPAAQRPEAPAVTAERPVEAVVVGDVRETASPRPSAPAAAPRSEPSYEAVWPADVGPPKKPRSLTIPPISPPPASQSPPDKPARSPFDFEDTPARPPRRPWSEVLQSFMQEKNIRWGELVSGILIVGSAVGLVVSLRRELQATIPYFPALLFMLITGAIHGAGLYSLKKWKLATTSRGMLTIGLLLIPLNLFAACLLARGSERPITDPAVLGAIALGLVGYTTMTFASARPLFRPENGWIVAGTVLGIAFWQIVLNRALEPGTTITTANVLLAPVTGLFIVGSSLFAWRQRHTDQADEQAARGLSLEQHLQGFGLMLFATLCALAMAAAALGSVPRLLDVCAPVLLPLASLGWLVPGWRLMQGRSVEWERFTGIALVFLGAFHVVLALVFAWPDPIPMFIAATIGAIVLGATAGVLAMPAMSSVAAAVGAFGMIVGLHFVAGSYNGPVASWPAQHGRVMMSVTTSVNCALVSALSILGSAGVTRRGGAWSEHARAVMPVGLAAAACSITVALIASFLATVGGSMTTASAVLVWHALLVLTAGMVWSERWLLRIGQGVLLVALLHITYFHPEWFAWWNTSRARPFVLTAIQVQLALVSLGALAAKIAPRFRVRESSAALLAGELAGTAGVLAVPTAVMALGANWTRAAALTADLSLVSVGLLAGNLVFGGLSWLRPLQFSLYASGAAGTCAVFLHLGDGHLWTNPRLVAWQLTTLAAIGGTWHGVAWAASRLGRPWLAAQRERLDVVVSSALSVVLFGWAVVACWPGILGEFGMLPEYLAKRVEFTWLNELAASNALWIPLGALVVCLMLGQTSAAARLMREALTVCGFAALVLVASQFADQLATASAMRWLLASGLLGFALAMLVGRSLWGRRELAPSDARPKPKVRAEAYVWSSLACSLVPLVLLMIVAIVRAASGGGVAGPSDNAWLGRLAAEANYGIPLIMILAAVQVLAWDRASRSFAQAGGATLLVLVATWVLAATFAPLDFDRVPWMTRYSQLSALVMALYGVGWRMLEGRLARFHETSRGGSHMMELTFTVVALATVAVPVLAAMVNLVAGFGISETWALALSRPFAWLSVAAGLSFVSLVVAQGPVWLRACLSGLGLTLFVGLLSAAAVTRWPHLSWPAPLIVFAGLLGASALQMVLAAMPRRAFPKGTDTRKLHMARVATTAAMLVASYAALLQFAEQHPSPTREYSVALTVFVVAALAATLILTRWFSYAALTAVFVGILFMDTMPISLGSLRRSDFLLHGNVVFCCLCGIACRMIDWWAPRLALRPVPETRWSAAHLMVAPLLTWLAAALVAFATLLRLVDISTGPLVRASGWASLVAIASLLIISLGDRQARGGLVHLYVLGLTATVFSVLRAASGSALPAYLGLATSAYVAAAAWLWRNQFGLWKWARRYGMVAPDADAQITARWFLPAELGIVLATTVLQLMVLFASSERELRVVAALTPLIGAIGVATLSSAASSEWQRRSLIWSSLGLFTTFCVYSSWSDLAPSTAAAVWIARLIRVSVVGALLTLLYGLVAQRAVRLDAVWRSVLQRMTSIVAVSAVVCLVLLLALEVRTFVVESRVMISTVDATIVAIMFLLMLAGLIATALWPDSPGSTISLRRRQAYVYGAELIGVLLGVHVAVAMPWLMQPAWRPYWPYGLMALAFAGVGAGELFERRKLAVLAEPVLRTGLALPLIPLVLMWFLRTQSDYAIVVTLGGLLYLVMSFTRRSVLYLAAAVACGNLAIWSLLSRHASFEFTQHPQLWLIPPALSVMAAAFLSRERLTPAQFSAALYGGALVIYVSSTMEVFMHGIGQQLWPPVFLIVLAVIGVLLGILLQIRAFLVLGTAFVFVAMVSMVMHAQRVFHHVWPWWAFGIALGIGILVFFAFFEKRRRKVGMSES